MPVIKPKALAEYATQILRAAGTPSDIAGIVAELLVNADLSGVESHGVMRVPLYVERIEKGELKPSERPDVLKRNGGIAVVDGRFGFGQVTALKMMNLAIEIAESQGVSSVSSVRTHHVGRLADYTQLAAERNMIGIAMVNTTPGVAPWGGRERLLGTNPISFAVPAGHQNPIVADFATSISSGGKIEVKKWRNEKLPEGWLIDTSGNPSTNPDDFFVGGAISTGGHRGYALSLLAEVLGGALNGEGVADEYHGFNGTFMQAISVEHFISIHEFKANVDKLILKMRGSMPAKGFTEVILPGEPERREMRKREVGGIEIDNRIWDSIAKVAARLGVESPVY